MTFFKGKICKLIAINSIVFSCFVFDGNSQELPENPSVTYGNASFEKVGNNLTIKQSTQKLITNWSSFNIGKANQVEFKQPSSISTALNRVQSNDPTHIYGSLKSLSIKDFEPLFTSDRINSLYQSISISFLILINYFAIVF